MGYELNKLMRQFGVATPGAVAYSGATVPGAPVAPTKSEDDAAYQAALTKYDLDKAAYEKDLPQMRAQEAADRAAYAKYLKDYQDRVLYTPQYTDQQYYAKPSAAMRYATGPEGMGVEKFNQNIRDAIAANPGMTPQQARAEMDKYGITGYDVARARGTLGMWGDTPIAAPVYGAPLQAAASAALTPTTKPVVTPPPVVKPPVVTPPPAQPQLYQSLTAQSSPADIAAAYNQYIGGPNADTSINRATAEKYLQDIGVSPTTINQAYNTFLTTQSTPLYESLGAQSSAADVARAYNQYVAGTGGDTAANQQAAINYLQSIGVSPTTINQAYDTYKAGTFSHGGGVHGMAQRYNVGGAVRRFQVGGNQGEIDTREEMPMPAVTATPGPLAESPAARPIEPKPAATTPVSPAANELMTLLQRYGMNESVYAPELKAARQRADAETKAFTDMIQNAMKGETATPDKSEMYFRLAAAFGAPTKTGHFAENLGMVGKELGEYAKETRAAKKADQQLKLQLGLEAQKIKAQGAREELTTLRQLTGEEMKDKRAVLQEYIKSGRPQSEAGKAAVDAGLVQGTPEFSNFVNKYIDEKLSSGNLLKEAMVAVAQGNLAIRQSAESRAAEGAKKLTPAELKLKTETEDRLTTVDNVLRELSRAYDLNKSSFDSTLKDKATLTILEQTGSKDPRVLATQEMLNLLKSGMISGAAEKMKGVLSDSDIKLLTSVAGIDAKSRAERTQILKNTYTAMKNARTAQQKRLNEISQGLYRETTPAPGAGGELD